jgi:hypothetical protein
MIITPDGLRVSAGAQAFFDVTTTLTVRPDGPDPKGVPDGPLPQPREPAARPSVRYVN